MVLCLFFSLLLLPRSLPAQEAGPEDFLVRDRVLVKYRGTAREVVIPPTLGIDRVGQKAFAGAPVSSVTVPMGVAVIDERAFAGCGFLKTVSLPSTLTVLGRRAFFNCVQLERVNIPIGLVSIEEGAFFNCLGLKEMALPPSVKTLGSRAFSGCFGLERLSLSRRTRLGERPFMGVRCEITWRD
ncbi:MAG: leucine-rich repeat domain-containing protein [Treponema sp.]|jgi:hypothetical protein|nr:leucine-rich repeat domain-containing protein [Treponema sp.]